MNLNKSERIGFYVSGVLDSAAARGVLTQATIATMLNGIMAAYGENIPVEDPGAVDAPQTGINAGLDALGGPAT